MSAGVSDQFQMAPRTT
ncbi:Protein of unknown function [Gryllus bimaculatus]|nr:Protein of unknown function [Gryllus bimaculatus]